MRLTLGTREAPLEILKVLVPSGSLPELQSLSRARFRSELRKLRENEIHGIGIRC
jgi:hypothetical protein